MEDSAAGAPADTDPASESEPSAHATPAACGPANDNPRANAAAPTRTPLLTDITHKPSLDTLGARLSTRIVKIAKSSPEGQP